MIPTEPLFLTSSEEAQLPYKKLEIFSKSARDYIINHARCYARSYSVELSPTICTVLHDVFIMRS